MGIYRQTGGTHNNKPVWRRRFGTAKLFYDTCKLYDDEGDNCVINDNDITVGWTIKYPKTDDDWDALGGSMATTVPTGDLWPHQVRSWQYYTGDGWELDPQLTVMGNININFLCFNIDIIFTVEGLPDYPENMTVIDQTGDSAYLEGVYRGYKIWRYGDWRLFFNGKYFLGYQDNNHLYI